MVLNSTRHLRSTVTELSVCNVVNKERVLDQLVGAGYLSSAELDCGNLW